MKHLYTIMQKAKTSAFYLWLLNFVLLRGVPFNKPHRFKIVKITDNFVEIKIPYRRSNLNHLKGLHACALATVAEYSSGLLLLSHLNPSQYRLIMQSMEIEYFFQGKMDGIARFSLDQNWLQENVFTPLEVEDAIIISPAVNVHDAQNNHLVTGKINWQVKRWDRVRTRIGS